MLDPFSLIINALYGQFLYHAAKLKESVRQFHSTLDMEPRFWVAHICLAKSYEQLGLHSEALAACDRAWEYSGHNSEALSLAGYIHAVSGDATRAQGTIEQLQEERAARYVPPYNLALVFAGLDQTDAATSFLEQAFADRDVHMTFLLDHKWSSLRSDPRFTAILRRCGLARSF